MSFQFHKKFTAFYGAGSGNAPALFNYWSVGHLWKAFSFNPKFNSYGTFKKHFCPRGR